MGFIKLTSIFHIEFDSKVSLRAARVMGCRQNYASFGLFLTNHTRYSWGRKNAIPSNNQFLHLFTNMQFYQKKMLDAVINCHFCQMYHNLNNLIALYNNINTYLIGSSYLDNQIYSMWISKSSISSHNQRTTLQ